MPAQTLLRRIAPFAALAATVSLPAQVQWSRFEYFPRTYGPLVYDVGRDRFVQLAPPNGTVTPETWEFDGGTGWLRRQPGTSPPWLAGHAMAHDAARDVTVLFSGYGISTFAWVQTYEWNGVDWTNVSPAVQPSAREGHAMAFDVVRGKVVLFGGRNPDPNGFDYGDTWEWDGAQWTQRAVAGPMPRRGHGLVYDVANDNVVLFGGGNGYVPAVLGDTWALTASGWTPRAGGPPARMECAMAYDRARARTVLFGGSASGTFLDDTWEWDGNAWSPAATLARPSPRARAGLAGDPVGGGVLLVGGYRSEAFADTWRWDGNAWTLIQDTPQPTPRHSHAMAFDEARGEMLVFGGVDNSVLGDLWLWNGTQWTAATAAGPSPRMRSRMAFDVARGETVMFGGELPGGTNQTWTWNGVAWSQRLPPISPAARFLHAMAYDRQRARIVLFGGCQYVPPGLYLGDTWEWDGTAWLQRTVPAPPPRASHAMAYDARRGVTVLYGGIGAGQPFGTWLTDTWEWNGTAWTQRLPADNPGGRAEFGMAFDTARERVVVFGDTSNQDAFEWDGVDWSLRSVPAAPPARGRSSLVFDTWREQTLLFGGQSSGPNHADLWRYDPVAAAAVIPFGSACAGSLGPPHITAQSRPWLGDSIAVVVGNGPSAAPTAMWAGASNTVFGPVTLPLALAPIGMPGCSLYASIDASVLTTATPAGQATIVLSVPNQPGLLGFEVHCQGAFFDPLANPFGIATSGALTLRLGGR
ncbi:MAG TPA: kelch repeat-containing protein [Planctomycetota bacterium]